MDQHGILVLLNDTFSIEKTSDFPTFPSLFLASSMNSSAPSGAHRAQAVDWWSLGILVFELMTSDTPWECGARSWEGWDQREVLGGAPSTLDLDDRGEICAR